MSQDATLDQPGLRPGRKPSRKMPGRSVRPSLIDSRFLADIWLVPETEEGRYGLYLGELLLAGIHGVCIDLPSLNQLVERLRSRRVCRRPAACLSVGVDSLVGVR